MHRLWELRSLPSNLTSTSMKIKKILTHLHTTTKIISIKFKCKNAVRQWDHKLPPSEKQKLLNKILTTRITKVIKYHVHK